MIPKHHQKKWLVNHWGTEESLQNVAINQNWNCLCWSLLSDISQRKPLHHCIGHIIIHREKILTNIPLDFSSLFHTTLGMGRYASQAWANFVNKWPKKAGKSFVWQVLSSAGWNLYHLLCCQSSWLCLDTLPEVTAFWVFKGVGAVEASISEMWFIFGIRIGLEKVIICLNPVGSWVDPKWWTGIQTNQEICVQPYR